MLNFAAKPVASKFAKLSRKNKYLRACQECPKNRNELLKYFKRWPDHAMLHVILETRSSFIEVELNGAKLFDEPVICPTTLILESK